MTDEKWATERMGDVLSNYRVKEILYEETTSFQRMQLVETHSYGRMLLLDDFVQTTEKDEFIYHEMLSHVPLCAHPDPRRVLIIGGGDGGILREVLRHPNVEKAVLVEIDGKVIDFSKRYLPSICQGSFDDPRAEIVVADGAEYIKKHTGRFDVVIVDSSDPVGPAQVLFSRPFYQDIHARLTDQGIMVRQTGSTFLQPDEQKQAYCLVREVFSHNALYVFTVPTYVGGLFSCIFSSRGIDPLAITAKSLEPRFAPLSASARYYNPGVHVGAFQLPGYVRDRQRA
jgi:spermidine synthase